MVQVELVPAEKGVHVFGLTHGIACIFEVIRSDCDYTRFVEFFIPLAKSLRDIVDATLRPQIRRASD